MSKIYVVGHKNPDTDSICSAIAYAYVKNEIAKRNGEDNNYVAARAGQLNAETVFVLQEFGQKLPHYLNNIGTRVSNMEIHYVPGISKDVSLKKAFEMMASLNVVTLPIVEEDQSLLGTITINDIALSYMQEQDGHMLSKAKTSYRNILETLDATLLVGDPEAYCLEGEVEIAAANPELMEEYIHPGDIVIVGNRYESQLSAIESGAACLVICLGSAVSKSIQKLAASHGCAIMVTPYDTYRIARQIGQSMPVEAFMKKEGLKVFHLTDYTDDIKDTMMSSRTRDFAVLDRDEKYAGMISRRNFLGIKKREVILVDHNEKSQAVDNIESAVILEILDHHRIGSLETMEPVFFRNEPIGCTATIVYKVFKEQNVAVPKDIAGLLLSAILSDTLIFESPTCTEQDVTAANELASIAGLDIKEYGGRMFEAASDLNNKTPEEIFYQDYKRFEFGKTVFTVSQIPSMSLNELEKIQEKLLPFLEKHIMDRPNEMGYLVLTNIMNKSSRLLCCGRGTAALAEEAFRLKTAPVGELGLVSGMTLEGVVSRKKQIIPAFMEALNG